MRVPAAPGAGAMARGCRAATGAGAGAIGMTAAVRAGATLFFAARFGFASGSTAFFLRTRLGFSAAGAGAGSGRGCDGAIWAASSAGTSGGQIIPRLSAPTSA